MEREAELDNIRATQQIETENISKRHRFGCFSKPPPLCMNDPYNTKAHKYRGDKNSELRKNMSTNKTKNGKNDDIYFSVPSYVTIGDTYQDPNKLAKYNYVNNSSYRPQTITAWRPSNVNKTNVVPPYPYIEDPTKSDAALPLFKQEEEKDKELSNKRFSSSVGRGNEQFNRFSKYMSDPYDYRKDKERNEKITHRNKFQNGPFQNSDKQARPFTTDNDLHDKRNHATGKPSFIQVDLDTLAGGLARKTQNTWKPNNAAKKGYNCTLNKLNYAHYGRYYKEKPANRVTDEKIWIPNNTGNGTVPNPSIQNNARNGHFANKTMFNWKRS